jgi:DNA polymerase III delta subunit
MDDTQKTSVKSRRAFMRMLGISSAGISVAGAAQLLKDKAGNGLGITRAEIEKLKADYENLDRRTKIILRVILVFSGLDLFLAI